MWLDGCSGATGATTGGGIEGAPGSAHRAPRSRQRARLGVRMLGFRLGSAVLG